MNENLTFIASDRSCARLSKEVVKIYDQNDRCSSLNGFKCINFYEFLRKAEEKSRKDVRNNVANKWLLVNRNKKTSTLNLIFHTKRNAKAKLDLKVLLLLFIS